MADTHDYRPAGEGPPAGPPGKEDPPQGRRRGLAFQLAAVALTVVSALAGTGLARWLRNPPSPPPAERPPAKGVFNANLFRGWPKPDLVLVFSGQQQGYLLPCGCSRPQIGGLERRYNFLRWLRKQGWPHAAFDLGDVPQARGPAGLPNLQGLIKYRYSMAALKEMGYTAVGIGESEVRQSLFDVLAEYALQDPVPRVVVANLREAEKYFPDQTEPWKQADPRATNGVKVGVTSIIGPTVAERIKELTRGHKAIAFGPSRAALDGVLKKMGAAKVDLPVLLYQGPVSRTRTRLPHTEALACAEAYPQFPVVLCLSEEDDPPANPVEVRRKDGTKSLVIYLGRKGKFLGVVGVYKTPRAARPFEFRYQMVEMTEDFLTARGDRDNHPISKLVEEYTRELRDKNYLGRYGQRPHLLQAMAPVPGLARPGTPTFVGSEKCKRCHEEAYDVWKKSKHSHAYQTLVDAKRPSLRQYDPECIVCHTVGFGYQGGFTSAEKTAHLKDVGCESCHGPASLHVVNPANAEWQRRLNPWKAAAGETPAQKAKRLDRIDQMCQHCHDVDNDVTWSPNGLKRKWPQVDHPSPKPANPGP